MYILCFLKCILRFVEKQSGMPTHVRQFLRRRFYLYCILIMMIYEVPSMTPIGKLQPNLPLLFHMVWSRPIIFSYFILSFFFFLEPVRIENCQDQYEWKKKKTKDVVENLLGGTRQHKRLWKMSAIYRNSSSFFFWSYF